MRGLKLKAFSLILTLFTLHFSFLTVGYASGGNWAGVSAKIEKVLNEAVKTYEGGKNDEAMEMVADAYFGIFEGEKANMEIAVRRFISLKIAVKLEKGFNEIRKAMHKGAPVNQIRQQTSDLINNLKEAAGKLDGKGVGLDVRFI